MPLPLTPQILAQARAMQKVAREVSPEPRIEIAQELKKLAGASGEKTASPYPVAARFDIATPEPARQENYWAKHAGELPPWGVALYGGPQAIVTTQQALREKEALDLGHALLTAPRAIRNWGAKAPGEFEKMVGRGFSGLGDAVHGPKAPTKDPALYGGAATPVGKGLLHHVGDWFEGGGLRRAAHSTGGALQSAALAAKPWLVGSKSTFVSSAGKKLNVRHPSWLGEHTGIHDADSNLPAGFQPNFNQPKP